MIKSSSGGFRTHTTEAMEFPPYITQDCCWQGTTEVAKPPFPNLYSMSDLNLIYASQTGIRVKIRNIWPGGMETV
ncbi:hypothetical protein HNY73_018246 [Argiope bruennichi]|uniref:Uncharacterized protein n=1 Tax=Argiope bruennichi TaxID=94029 RepID=A0A8T0EGB5_ARGBR|nr:hypothetical protein HNY73_018246 [Argiope bruennichi]